MVDKVEKDEKGGKKAAAEAPLASDAPRRRRPVRGRPAPEEEEKAQAPTIERLIQVPLIVRLRATERDFAQFLDELQLAPPRPSAVKGGPGSGALDLVPYLCLRGLQVVVKDSRSGVLEATVAVGALFPEKLLKEQGMVLKEDERPGGGGVRSASHDPFRY